MLRDTPDVTCPSDFPDSDRRKEVSGPRSYSTSGDFSRARACIENAQHSRVVEIWLGEGGWRRGLGKG